MSDPYSFTYDAFLFDMDGTILNSIAVAERIWGRWAVKFGLDSETFLPTIHGRRAFEVIASLGLPGVDAEAEAALITAAEIEEVDGVVPIPGARSFLSSLPPERWAVVTSAPKALAKRRMEAAGLPLPSTVISAEDVRRGKPAPDCFRLAADRLSTDPERCLVFEDAEAGISAAIAAECRLLVITETHRHAPGGRHHHVQNFEGIGWQIVDGALALTPVQAFARR